MKHCPFGRLLTVRYLVDVDKSERNKRVNGDEVVADNAVITHVEGCLFVFEGRQWANILTFFILVSNEFSREQFSTIFIALLLFEFKHFSIQVQFNDLFDVIDDLYTLEIESQTPHIRDLDTKRAMVA